MLRRRRSPPIANRRPCRTRRAPAPGFRSFAILPDEAFRSGRLLRFARNDSKKSCHCEERSDEAISSNIDLRSSQYARLGGEAEHPPPVEAEALVLRLAAHEANVDLLDDDRELEGGEHLMPADRGDVEAGARGVTVDCLGPARGAVAPGRHRRGLP